MDTADVHNHEIKKEVFQYSSKQRKLSQDEVKEIKAMIDLKANKKLIKHHLIASTGKKVTLKDIHNVGRSLESNMNNLASVVAELRNIESSENAATEILVDESGTIQGIYLQTKEMIDTFLIK